MKLLFSTVVANVSCLSLGLRAEKGQMEQLFDAAVEQFVRRRSVKGKGKGKSKVAGEEQSPLEELD